MCKCAEILQTGLYFRVDLLCHLCPQVYNVNEMYGPEAERPVDITINMAKVMGVFLAQLRLVLGHLTFTN